MQNAQASRFLSLLDPTASAFTFQTVPEPKGKSPNLGRSLRSNNYPSTFDGAPSQANSEDFYNRFAYWPEMSEALEKWSRHVERIVQKTVS